jgi:pimeloyl-ACP methyl ester carboxylesterase
MDEEPHIEAKSLMSISCPTTIMAGENDIIKPEETKAIASAIPGAELVIVPGHGHTLPKEAPQDVTDALFRTMVRACEES